MTERGLKNINVFYSTFTNFFLIFVTFFYVFNVFYFFLERFFYIYGIKSLLSFNRYICTFDFFYFFYICELSFNRDLAHC